MKINPKFEYIQLKRTTNEDGSRYYLDPNTNSPLSSVTTILSATADKRFLKEWQERVGLEKANTIRDDAANLGTLMHTHLECHIKNEPRPTGTNFIRKLSEGMANVIIEKGLCNVDELWGLEVPLYYPELFAGTTDAVGLYKGKPAIFDYKSTKKMKLQEYITDYFLQISAYGLSHDKVYGTDIDTGVIFMVDRNLNFKTFVIEGDVFRNYQCQYLNRVSEYFGGVNP